MKQETVTTIPLVRRGVVVGHTIVDPEDKARFSQWRWNLHKTGYAYRNARVNGKVRSYWLNREIMGEPVGGPFVIDHINEDRLDNRKENLRRLDRLTNGFRGTGWLVSEASATTAGR